MNADRNILQAIGNTSLVELRKIVPPGCAKVFAKLEWENPTGSMKDRSAQAMISRAEEDGRLKPGDTIVEYTGGSTGVSLALVCEGVRSSYHYLRFVQSGQAGSDVGFRCRTYARPKRGRPHDQKIDFRYDRGRQGI